MLVVGFPDIRTALTYAAGIATRLTAILAFFEAGRKFLGSIWRWFQRPWGSSSKTKHRVELKIVPDHGMCQWQEGSIGLEKQAMLVHCKLYLTNVAPVRPLPNPRHLHQEAVRPRIHPSETARKRASIATGDRRRTSGESVRGTLYHQSPGLRVAVGVHLRCRIGGPVRGGPRGEGCGVPADGRTSMGDDAQRGAVKAASRSRGKAR
jgi:hypothetical protein